MDWIRERPFLVDIFYVIFYSLVSKTLKEVVSFMAQKRDSDENIHNNYFLLFI